MGAHRSDIGMSWVGLESAQIERAPPRVFGARVAGYL
jgi:hypothetical protein